MAEMFTEFATAFKKHQLIRPQNFRSSLQHTSIYTKHLFANDKDWLNADAGSDLYICAIPYTASIKKFTVAFDKQTTGGRATIGIAGINSNGTLTLISNNLDANSGIKENIGTAYTETSVWRIDNHYKTLYEFLVENGKPKATFAPYANDKYGMLLFHITTQEPVASTQENAANLINESFIELAWTESTTTTSSLSVVVPDTASHRAA